MKELKQNNCEKNQIIFDSFGTILVIATIAICAIDLWSHSNGGIFNGATNPERRRILVEFFGPLARNIGNMGLTAILSSLAVFSKHILSAINFFEISKNKIKTGFIGILAIIIALNISNEVTIGANPEGIPDLIGAAIAMVMALGSAEFVATKVKDYFNN